MHAWEAIQQALDYIDENLQEELRTEVLSEMVSLSPYYFQRLFKRLVSKSVQEYIKLRRLSKAIDEFRSDEQHVIDVALNYGFSSHANFTRAFKETYGITPEEYKRTRPMLNTVSKPEISMNYMLLDEGVPLIIGNIVLEIQRKTLNVPENYIGFSAEVNIAAQIPVGESTGIDVPGQLWARFHNEKLVLGKTVNPDIGLGMSCMANPEKGTFQYFAGALLQGEFDNTNDFVIQELPAGDYIVCKIEAESFESLVTEALDKAEKYYTNYDYGNCMEIWVMPLSH